MAIYKIIASTLGTDTGPFVIKSNTGAILATGVTRAQLLAGFTINVPAGVTSVTVTNVVTNTTCVTDQTFQIPNEGFWEMEKTNVEQVSDHYGIIATAYSGPVETFVADDVVGIYDGVVTGTTWNILGGPEAITGTTYNGGGLLIVTAANTNSTTNVQAGATVQLGYDTDAYTGSFGGTTTVATGATVNVLGANEPNGRAVFSTLTNNGAVNITGKDSCGEGYFTTTTLNNGSLITIDKAVFRPNAYGTNVGTILVKDGATLEASTLGIPATQTLQLNGCGKCNEIGGLEGALLHGSAAATVASPIVLQSEVCMKNQGSQTTFSGQLTGNFKLKLGNYTGTTTTTGSHTFTNATATFENTIEVTNTSLYNTGTNTLSKADIVLVENGKIQQDGGVVNFGSLSSDSATSVVLCNSSVTMNIKENGNTTYAGIFQNSTPGTPYTFNMYGPDTNQIKLTGAGGIVQLNSYDGAKIIAQGGTYEFWNSTNGGTISAGTSKTTIIKTLYLKADAFLDVYAASPGPGSGKITSNAVAYLFAGWKVNIKDPLPAGTYDILVSPNPTGAYANLPTVAANASGLTASFAWVGTTLRMTLA
jgi:hypothetical protein